MRLKSDKPLLVVANPFATALDKNGRPCCVVQYDPEHIGKGTIRWIGAKYENKVTEPRPKFGGQQTRFDRRAIFDLTVQKIVDSQYHRERIAMGGIVAADEETAARAKVKFQKPSVVLEAAMHRAIAMWEAQHGEPPQKSDWTDLLKNWP